MKAAKTYENNDQFLDMPLKHGPSLIDIVNHTGTLELGAITQENDQISRKRHVFGRASQPSIGSYRLYKSSRNPITVGNSS